MLSYQTLFFRVVKKVTTETSLIQPPASSGLVSAAPVEITRMVARSYLDFHSVFARPDILVHAVKIEVSA